MTVPGWLARPTRRHLARLAAVVAVIAVAAAVLTVLDRRDGPAEERADALAAATSSIETLLTYDARTIDGLVAENAPLVTGTFEDEYATLVRDRLTTPVVDQGLRTTTRVAEAAVISLDDDSAEVLLFLNQDFGVVGEGEDSLGSSGSRVQVTMREVEGRWRVSAMETI